MLALALIGLLALCTPSSAVRPKMRTQNGSIFLDVPAGQDVNIVQWNADGSLNSTIALSQLLQQATVDTQNQISGLRTDLQGQSECNHLRFFSKCSFSMLPTVSSLNANLTNSISLSSTTTLSSANAYCAQIANSNYIALTNMIAALNATVNTLITQKANVTDTASAINLAAATALNTAQLNISQAVTNLRNTDLTYINASIANTNSNINTVSTSLNVVNSLVNATEKCLNQNFVYSYVRQRCEPAQPPVPCSSALTVSIATATCSPVTFGSSCNIGCPAGYTGSNMVYFCNASGIWQPVVSDIVCNGQLCT